MRTLPLPQMLALSLMLAALSGCRGWTTDKPPVHLNPNMDTQAKHRPYRAESFFADGRSMRTPPVGTIARTVAGNESRDFILMGQSPLTTANAHLFTGIADDGTVPDALPPSIDVDQKLLDRGQERYNIYCAPCHGQHGRGNGTVASRLTIKPPDFHDSTRMKLPVSHFFRIITHGKPLPEDHDGTSNLNMPNYAAQLPIDDRWAVAAYLRALQHLKRNELPAPSPITIGGAAAMPAGEDDGSVDGDDEDDEDASESGEN